MTERSGESCRSMPSAAIRAVGMARSLATYYGPFWRGGRLAAFYRQFLAPGDLAFDLGSHVGNRVHAFRRLGAHVVAVEPQPDFLTVLRLLYGRDTAVRIEPCGVAATPGVAKLHLSTRTPTVSSFAQSWIEDVRADDSFRRVRWDRVVPVALITLDELIARHGEPQFVKIDVEGYELEVLRGLSRGLAALSFEYLPVAAGRAIACVDRLGDLGDYRFRRSRVETHRWADPTWLAPEAMITALRSLPDSRSGDVYAVRRDRRAE
ncbi:MAG: FkbM family methyltransferase [Microlunatus sp.]|nr:FkbM family methyltransferase [Microlunatus sp.]MDN5769396.1 FkbM family methyltransferase [Microlunatus sp.]